MNFMGDMLLVLVENGDAKRYQSFFTSLVNSDGMKYKARLIERGSRVDMNLIYNIVLHG
jgi:hypothetical protein